jgi:ketosteroid isomerase-like protein
MTRSRFGFLVPLLCVALASYDAASRDLMAQTPSDDPAQALLEADRLFSEEAAERGVDGWLAWFEADGTMVQGEGEVRGHDAIRELMAPFFADSTIQLVWDPLRAEISEDNRLGYTIGAYRVIRVGVAEDEPPLSHGMYLTVWRRQADGAWKVAADIGAPAGE